MRCAVFGFVLFGLTACGQHDILENFERINNGLESGLMPHEQRIAKGRAQLEQRGCAQAVTLADSLRSDRVLLTARIDSMKVRMLGSALDDITVADSAYDLNGTGDRLRTGLIAFFQQAKVLLGSDSTAQQVDRCLEHMEDPPGPETWRTRNFYHTPRVAAVTILSKYNSDVAMAEALCMDKFLRDCPAR
ncbi:MAG TPA: hypothetical protein VHL57_00495 [Flavobacteriales bacterium]|jgi:hypothetical protein|nr:hypothetical protein [Flavobacteriales bacterium]